MRSLNPDLYVLYQFQRNIISVWLGLVLPFCHADLATYIQINRDIPES